MPPVRTMPAKPMKTERTHEENQERAYIAASRRSDRSLEARMESARRASEIHKKRTGRALRVTEQDVINEEMYEEEDEDLDAQIRRLTQHMANASPDFSHRIQSLLLAQSQIRMNLHNANNAAQYSNGASFAPNQYIQNMQTMQMQNLQYSQNMRQGQQMQAMQTVPTMPNMTNMTNMNNMNNMNMSNMSNLNTVNPHMIASQMRQPNGRHTPYPMMNQGMRQQSHQRSASIAAGTQGNQTFRPSPSPATPSGLSTEEQRRLSLPASARPSLSRNASSIHTVKMESSRPAMTSNQSASPVSKEGSSPQTEAGSAAFYSVPSTPLDPKSSHSNINPLTTSLPTESQMFLGPHLNPNDPTTNVLMAGSNYQQQFFGFNPNPSMKPQVSQFSQDGMNQTLAYGMPSLDTNSNDLFLNQSGNYLSSASTEEYPTFSPNDDELFSAQFDQSTNISRNSSNQGVNMDDFSDLFDDKAFGDTYYQ